MHDAHEGRYITESWQRPCSVRDAVFGWYARLYHVLTIQTPIDIAS